jgi:hypothetical protein
MLAKKCLASHAGPSGLTSLRMPRTSYRPIPTDFLSIFNISVIVLQQKIYLKRYEIILGIGN